MAAAACWEQDEVTRELVGIGRGDDEGRWLSFLEQLGAPVIIHDGVEVVWASAPVRHLVGRPAREIGLVDAPGDGGVALVPRWSAPLVLDGTQHQVCLLDAPAPEGPTAGQELERLDRLELVGIMSAGLAHDLNNPLGAMSLQLGTLMNRLAAIDEGMRSAGAGRSAGVSVMFTAQALAEARASVTSLREAVDFMARQVRDFSRLSRGDDVARGSVDLRAAMNTAIGFVRAHVCRRATVELAIAPGIPVAAAEGAVVRVLMNLLVNAAEAFRDDQPAANRVIIEASVEASQVVLDVSDNGPGVPEALRARLFEPFVSGKAGGRGVGLAVARTLLRQQGGDLELVETGAGGTRFRCRLPRAGRS